MSSTRVSRHLKAPRERVYAALVDAAAIAAWKVPTGMTSEVHEFEGREGGWSPRGSRRRARGEEPA